MSLRSQLLKSGLANKDQAKKADKEAKKRLHEQLHTSGSHQDVVSQEIAERLKLQQDADRERNRALEEERRQREGRYRAMDIMVANDLKDPTAEIPYYFVCQGNHIDEIFVTEAQQSQLAAGALAVVTFDSDFRNFLVDATNADKIRNCAPQYVRCWHPLA